MNSKELRALDAQCIEGTYGRFEPVINQGKGAICTDLEGKTYVDFTSGIGVNSLGFCDEQWVQAVCKQVQTLQHTSNLFYTLPGPKVAEKLTARTGMSKVFFGNSGAEANECAIKAARKYGNQKSDKKNQIVTLRDSFHGRTMATVSATGQDSMHKDFDPFVAGFQYCETNDIASLQRVVGENTCAVMIELIQGEGGVHVLDEDFVKEAEALCRKFDALLIVDEVQTGVGRTGYFFAYEPYGIKPDLITFAKGMGGGLPIGGVIFSDRAKGALSKGDHGSTFGANPIVCAGAMAVVDTVNEEFLRQVKEKGAYMAEVIRGFSGVEAVSGRGLMLGIKLKPQEGRTSASIVKAAIDKGLLVLTAKEKVRLLPPLNISKEEMEKGLAILKELLD